MRDSHRQVSRLQSAISYKRAPYASGRGQSGVCQTSSENEDVVGANTEAYEVYIYLYCSGITIESSHPLRTS